MIIQIDTREKSSQLERIIGHLDKQGVRYVISKLDVGDYMSLSNNRCAIDRKQSIGEYACNMGVDHCRFKNEILRAKEQGIKLIFLIEDDKVSSIEDVKKWWNPNSLFHQKYMTGEMLYKGMKTQIQRYGVEFEFCRKEETGYRIIDLLRKNGD